MFRLLSCFLDSLLNLWFSPQCPICLGSVDSGDLCTYCKPVYQISGKVCSRCGSSLTVDLITCGSCSDLRDPPVDRIRSLLWFSAESKVLVHLIKYQGKYEWMSIFLEQIKTMKPPFEMNSQVVIPVPIHSKKFIRRGFNQSEFLAEALSKNFNLEISFGLKKVKDTQSQSVLNLNDRRLNLKNVFAWDRRQPIPERAIIVDDIYTTGETLKECASTLKKLGTKEVFAWTLFRTPL